MASRKEAKSKAQMRKDKMKCNKPQRAPKGAKQKYIVKACDDGEQKIVRFGYRGCLLYTSPSPRDPIGSRMPSSA